MRSSSDLQTRAINTIRFLTADAVQTANSGHPGLPMGDAAIAYTLWMRHLKYNPHNPGWPNRDRFILSAGHGSMLLYSLLFLTGYDLSLDEIKHFRQWGSRTPGHPEYGLTPGVETTTGPLGQGFANGVGMAIAEAHLAQIFNKPGFEIINHFTYAIVSDGDLMEGISSEAASLAGHLRLGKLIYFYDNNHITIDGSTDLAFTEDRGARFAAYGWHVLSVKDGNDVEAIDQAIQQAKADERPTLIICRTLIGFGLPTRQDTNKAHGEAPGWEELEGAKKNLGWPLEPLFYIPDDVLKFYRQALPQGAQLEQEWNAKIEQYRSAFPELAVNLEGRLTRKLPVDWQKNLPEFPPDPKGMATRSSSGKVLNALAEKIPELIGGSADLAPSNNSWIQDSQDFQASSYQGRNFHFGVREHAMGAIVNGMAYHQGIIPYGATFFVFTDYMRPAIRLAALSRIPSIFIFTHDSIGLGEDGPTHQPVEHLAAMRAIPNVVLIRPADANEVREAWKIAILRRDGPTLLVLSRQSTPTFDRSKFNSAEGVNKGAYILADLGGAEPRLVLMASGTEVNMILEAGQRLAEDGVPVRIVSFPSWELFEKQTSSYRDEVLPRKLELRMAVEAGVPMGWERWVGDSGRILGVTTFGASAPYKELYEHYGFTTKNILQKARELLGNL